jgi:hypothetical protein
METSIGIGFEFIYIEKCIRFYVNHNVVVLVSVVRGLNAEDLLDTKVF